MTETINLQYSVQMRLLISRIQKSDLGGYKCISKNSIGDAEGNIRLYGKKIHTIQTRAGEFEICSDLRARNYENVDETGFAIGDAIKRN